ncbi:MAG: TrmH family RNA methyltransferase [Bacteroidales bacterium]|nr:TrmH family RNA methyltransferase [Bacteroidales bacterium]
MSNNANLFFKNFKTPNLKFKPIIIADNLRTPENIGSVIRLADNIDVEKLIFVNCDDNFRQSKIKRIAKTSIKNVNYFFLKDDNFKPLIPDNYNIIAIETTQGAENVFNKKLPEKSAFIVGNERQGISNEILNFANNSVFVPVIGKTKSMNVTHCLAVVLFEWLRQNYFQ